MIYCEYCFRWLISIITGKKVYPLKEDKGNEDERD